MITKEIKFQHEGRNYIAKLNHENWKSFGTVEARSWNVHREENQIARDFVLVEGKTRGFKGNNELEKAAIAAIENEANN